MANKLRVLNFSGLDIEQNTLFFKGLVNNPGYKKDKRMVN